MAQLLSLILLAVTIFAIVDAITADNWRLRFLPKVAWVLLIVLLPLIGSIVWFVLGKERAARSEAVTLRDAHRASATTAPTEDELAEVEREIAFHEKQAAIRRLEEKLQQRKGTDPTS